MCKEIININEEERDEIEALNGRKYSLNSLIGTLVDSELEIDERNWFYEKLVKDIKRTDDKFEMWWDKVSIKYNLDKTQLDNYYVDFDAKCIYKQEKCTSCDECLE